MSVTHERLLLLKNATVTRDLDFDDVCKEKYVYIAYNNVLPDAFEVSSITGDMVEWSTIRVMDYTNLVYEWEIQAVFFETYNIKPIWLYANQVWGLLNYTTGQCCHE